MLIEKATNWHDPREGRRRWFYDEYFHLVVWYGFSGDRITGFELSYGKESGELAVVWHDGHAVARMRVDEGERPGLPRMIPVLVAGGSFDVRGVTERFLAASRDIDSAVRSIVVAKLRECVHQSSGAVAPEKDQAGGPG